MSTPNENEVARLTAAVETHLNTQFIYAALVGAHLECAKAAPAQEQARLAIDMAAGKAYFTPAYARAARACHESLCLHVRSGLTLVSAAAAARRASPGREAFQTIQESAVDEAENTLEALERTPSQGGAQ